MIFYFIIILYNNKMHHSRKTCRKAHSRKSCRKAGRTGRKAYRKAGRKAYYSRKAYRSRKAGSSAPSPSYVVYHLADDPLPDWHDHQNWLPLFELEIPMLDNAIPLILKHPQNIYRDRIERGEYEIVEDGTGNYLIRYVQTPAEMAASAAHTEDLLRRLAALRDE
jgi:hypothetical protein